MSNIEQIKSLLDLPEVFDHYGISGTGRGKGRKYNCFVHNDKHPSLSVFASGKKYNCFSCGAQGDVFDFMKVYFALDIPEAMQKLNNDFLLHIDLDRKRSRETLYNEKLQRGIIEAEKLLKEQGEKAQRFLIEKYRALYKRQLIGENVECLGTLENTLELIEDILDCPDTASEEALIFLKLHKGDIAEGLEELAEIELILSYAERKKIKQDVCL